MPKEEASRNWWLQGSAEGDLGGDENGISIGYFKFSELSRDKYRTIESALF
jgi:hypothetical protein